MTNDHCRESNLILRLRHSASSHVANATKIARKVGTVNFRAFFSHDEMKSGSKAAAAEEEKTIIGSPLGELLIEPPLRFDGSARPF